MTNFPDKKKGMAPMHENVQFLTPKWIPWPKKLTTGERHIKVVWFMERIWQQLITLKKQDPA